MNSKMVVKLFNKGTPISALKIITTFPEDKPEDKEDKFPIIYVVIGAGLLAVILLAVAITVYKKAKK